MAWELQPFLAEKSHHYDKMSQKEHQIAYMIVVCEGGWIFTLSFTGVSVTETTCLSSDEFFVSVGIFFFKSLLEAAKQSFVTESCSISGWTEAICWGDISRHNNASLSGSILLTKVVINRHNHSITYKRGSAVIIANLHSNRWAVKWQNDSLARLRCLCFELKHWTCKDLNLTTVWPNNSQKQALEQNDVMERDRTKSLQKRWPVTGSFLSSTNTMRDTRTFP